MKETWEKAKELVKELAELFKEDEKKGDVEFLLKSDVAGIKRADIYKAKRDLGVQSAVTGFGKNQKTWWLIAE